MEYRSKLDLTENVRIVTIEGWDVCACCSPHVPHTGAVGGIKIECRFVPGHCEGSICYVIPSEEAVITGDALFHFSIGRTDLPGGDMRTLLTSIKHTVLALPDETLLLSGHSGPTTVAEERPNF